MNPVDELTEALRPMVNKLAGAVIGCAVWILVTITTLVVVL